MASTIIPEWRKHELWVTEARRLLKPEPVKLHKFPAFFKKALRAAGFKPPYGGGYGENILWEAAEKFGSTSWIDHWGEAKIWDVVCYVSEPYHVTREDHECLEKLCEATGLRYHVHANSWWYPGHTFRVIIRPKVDDEGKAVG